MKLSIIVPVYQEEKNIKQTLQKIKQTVHTPHEILILYDDKKDPTVGIVEEYKKQYKNTSIQLVKNNVGEKKGVMNAIKTGFSKAKGNAIVVLMADLSDDISQIDSMYSLFLKEYDIVCASRYMKGGKKIGGPILKTVLSKLAGLTLHYFFHIPTHDSTNAFKLYNRKIFQAITVESTGGFEYSLEIVVKAYKKGFRITEIPTVWKDRISGSSQFKIVSWIPKYLTWYVSVFNFPYSWTFVLLLTFLSIVSFWRGLWFYFFQDDYQFLWNGLYHPLFFLTFRHPGTPIEALLLGPILGLNSYAWEIVGIALKVCIAYILGIFIYKLTNSKKAGILSSLFFSVSYIGMYVVNTFNYDAPMLATIPLLVSFIYLIKAIHEEKKHIWIFVFCLFLAIFLDPARVIPTFLFLPFFPFLFSKAKNSVFVKKFIKRFLVTLVVVGLPIFLLWYVVVSRGAGSQFEIFLRGMVTNPGYMITKAKDIGNYFATIANVFTDVLYGLRPIEPKYETAIYTRAFGLLGVGIFVATLLSFFYFLRKKVRFFGIISFFIFWIYIFYVPNWLAEPRAPMTSINHYLFISGVGFIGLVAYLFSLIKKKSVLIILSICFILINIYKANLMLFQQLPFRSTLLIEKAWQKIVRTTPKKERNDLFFFTGNVYWTYYSFLGFGSYHLLLLQKDSATADLPILTTDADYALSLVCGRSIGITQIPLSHLYVWNVKTPGVLVDTTVQERNTFALQAQHANCTLLH